MKEIAYRGGVVRFRIPTDWREEYEPEGGGTFYSPDPNAGTLRLNVLTARSPKPLDPARPEDVLRAQGRPKPIELLPEGRALTSYKEETSEEGKSIVLYFWELAHVLPPNHAEIAIFSFTVRSEQVQDEAVKRDLAMIGAEIRDARFAHVVGE
jgi:hypothetical protein